MRRGESSVPKYLNFTVYCYKQGMTCGACWQTSRGQVANAPSWGRATHNKLLPQGPTFSIPFVRVHWAKLFVWRASSCTIGKPTFSYNMQAKNKHFYPHCDWMLLADPFLLLCIISWGCFWGKSCLMNSNWRSKPLSTFKIQHEFLPLRWRGKPLWPRGMHLAWLGAWPERHYHH